MFVGTNHLFPTSDHGDDMVQAFNADNEDRPITERWNALVFEIARPLEGNDFHSTSIWPSKAEFDAWRDGDDFKQSHGRITFSWFTGHPVFVPSEIVLNAEPGRAPGSPQPRHELGAGRGYVFQKLHPAPERIDDIVAAFAAQSAPTDAGWLWWDLRRTVGAPELVSVAYFDTVESAKAAADRFALLQPPGDPSWYTAPAETSFYVTEVERIPGMTGNNRRAMATA
jgi:heme-degrading monooxygenase HmoA